MRKKIFFVLFIIGVSFTQAQVFKGKGDKKIQIGANLQDGARGINTTFDLGLGENISVGLSGTYILGVKDDAKVKFKDGFDLKARFNANIGSVLAIDDNLDVYPGLHLGLKNFGGHLGVRYFFSDGFGVYTEFNVPLAKYDSNIVGFEKIHNQFSVNLGAVFNL